MMDGWWPGLLTLIALGLYGVVIAWWVHVVHSVHTEVLLEAIQALQAALTAQQVLTRRAVCDTVHEELALALFRAQRDEHRTEVC